VCAEHTFVLVGERTLVPSRQLPERRCDVIAIYVVVHEATFVATVHAPNLSASVPAPGIMAGRMTPFVTAGAGFLLAVLWFDLMFDVQAARRHEPELPEAVLASTASYYRRVTTAARPMNRLVAAVMVGTIVAIVVQLVRGDAPRWAAFVSLALTAGAISLAAVHTVPTAMRLGARSDTIVNQGRLARSILRDHVVCFAAVASVLVVELTFAR
jgi:hypothetical protein